MKTFVLGDVHGEYEKLKAVLEACAFDFEADRIIQLGDLVDRGPEPFKCVDLLLKAKNVIFIRGNHDEEFAEVFLKGGIHFGGKHGAWETIQAWNKLNKEQWDFYREFFTNGTQKDYFIEGDKCFVHGGFNRHESIAGQSKIQFYWDRDLLYAAMSANTAKYEEGNPHRFKMKDKFKEVYIGHTPTICWNNSTEPMFLCKNKVINVDTGAGKGGVLTVMNVDTKEYWQN